MIRPALVPTAFSALLVLLGLLGVLGLSALALPAAAQVERRAFRDGSAGLTPSGLGWVAALPAEPRPFRTRSAAPDPSRSQGLTAAARRCWRRSALRASAPPCIWLDERQGRRGKPRRLAPIAPPAEGPFHGPADTAGAPSEPAGDGAVSVALPPRDAWPEGLRGLAPAVLERHLMLGSCEEPDLSAGRGSFWTARLDPWTTLYGLSCTGAASNRVDRLYLVTAGDFQTLQPLSFAEPDGVDGWDATDVLTNAAVDEETGMLTSFSKARDAGDCGTKGIWAWTGQKFSLREYRAEAQCNGRPSEAWPVLFRARPR